MIRDQDEAQNQIVVTNRSGDELPFSRGILASSLLSTGIATEEAYRLSSVVQTRLLRAKAGTINAEALVETIHEILADEESDGTAERWLAWRRAKRSGRPIVVVFCGAPGVGKSTVATRLAVRFGVSSVITSDAIRDVLRTVIPAGVLPELHKSTFELIDKDTQSPFSNFDRQAHAVATATSAVAQRLVTERRSAILEGVHLLPGLITSTLSSHSARPIIIERLITEDSVDSHQSKLSRRALSQPLRSGSRHLADLDNIRSIQSHLQEKAEANSIAEIGTDNLTITTHEIVDEIAKHVTSEVDAA